MSDDNQKPFAEVFTRTGGAWELLVAGVPQGGTFGSKADADAVARAINAAVEAREAKLRGALRDVANLLGPAAEAPPDQFYEFNPMALRRVLERVAEVLSGVGPDYVPGDVACGLAWDLGAAQAKVMVRWAVLFDALIDNPSITGQQFAHLLTQFGVAPVVATAASLTDDELRAECRRRGFRTAADYHVDFDYGPFNEALAAADDHARHLRAAVEARTIHQHNLEVAERTGALADLPSELHPRRTFGDWGATMARDPQDDMVCRSCVGRNGHHEVGCPRVRGVAPARTSP